MVKTRKRYPRGINNFWCPKCKNKDINEHIKHVKRLRSLTKPILGHLPDPHYSWVELQRCHKCKIDFVINNGT